MDIEETRYGVCFEYGKTRYLGKILLFSGLFAFMLYKLDIQDPQESGCWYRVTASSKCLPYSLQNTEKSDWQTANKVDSLKFSALLRSLPDTL